MVTLERCYAQRVSGEESSFLNPLKALGYMITKELDMGGRIIKYTEIYVEIELEISHVICLSMWSGPKEEMKPIFSFIKLYIEKQKGNDKYIMDMAIMIISGWPSFLKEIDQEDIMDKSNLSLITMLAAGLTKTVEYRIGLSEDYGDLLAALELMGEGFSFLESIIPHDCTTCKKVDERPVSLENRHGLTIPHCTELSTVIMKRKKPNCMGKLWTSN